MSAPDTSTYILITPDTGDLPKSRTLSATGGLALFDDGPGHPVAVGPAIGGRLESISNFSIPGYVNYNGATFDPKTFQAGTGIQITNPDGQGGNSEWSVLDNTTNQLITVQALEVPIANRSKLNFNAGSNVSITVVDNTGTGAADVNISVATSWATPNAKYIIQEPEIDLPNAQALSSLSTGLLKVIPGGVVDTAIAGTDYQAPSANLTSLAAILPGSGTLIQGTGTGWVGTSLGSPGTVWTVNDSGTAGEWAAPGGGGGMTVEILDPSVTLVSMVTNIIYVPTSSSSLVLLQLPLTPVPGDIYEINGYGPSGWQLLTGGKTVNFGSVSTTSGISSSTRWGCLRIICVTPTELIAFSPFGTPIVT